MELKPRRLAVLDLLRMEGMFKLKNHIPEGRCPVSRCTRESKATHPLCHCHYQQRWRARSKRENAYALLKSHARQRGIEFGLTAEYFAGLTDALATFDHEAGSRGEVPTIDRIDASRGYVRGNVRVVSLSANTIKGNRERYLPEHVQAILDRKRDEAVRKFEELERRMAGKQRDDGCPF